MKAVGVRTKDELKPLVQKSLMKRNIPVADKENANGLDAEIEADLIKEEGNTDVDKLEDKFTYQQSGDEKGFKADLVRKTAVTDNVHRNENLTCQQDESKNTENYEPPRSNGGQVSETGNIDKITEDEDAVLRSKATIEAEGKSANKENIDTNSKPKNDTEGKSACREENSNRNSEISVEFTSSDSEVYTEARSSPVSEVHDLNSNSQEVEEDVEIVETSKQANPNVEKNDKKETEIKVALRVEDEIRMQLRKGEQNIGAESIHSESCYFTDSDPEGET